jgi:hypothetical protein
MIVILKRGETALRVLRGITVVQERGDYIAFQPRCMFTKEYLESSYDEAIVVNGGGGRKLPSVDILIDPVSGLDQGYFR